MLLPWRKSAGPGRPKHKDDPPVILATTIPKSLNRALREQEIAMKAAWAPLTFGAS